MKRFINYLVVALALTCVLTGCFLKKRDTIKIGVIIPMTGAGATTVDYWVNGFNMAVEKLNTDNTDSRYELIFEDCKSDPKESVSCYKRLEVQGVKYYVVVGGQFAMAVAPMTKGKDVVLFTSADYNEAILNVTDCAFRIFPSANALGKTVSDFMYNELKVTKAATITLNTVPCLQAHDVFCNNFEQLGGSTVYEDVYDIGAYDFRNSVNKMAQKDVEGIFITGFGVSPAAFCAQMAGNPKFDNTPFIGDMNLSVKSFVQNKKNDKVQVYYADAIIDDAFSTMYKDKYGEAANSYCGCAYLIPNIINQARKGVKDPKDINSQISFLRGRTIQSEVARIYIDEKGNGEMDMAIYKLQ